MSIADKISRLETAKEDIASAIENKGGTVNEGDGFEEFANDIGTIQTGGDLESFIAGTSTSVTYEGEIVRDCAFAGMSDLEEVNLPNALYIGCNAFSNFYNATIVSESTGDMHFNNDSLQTVNMPKVTNIMQDAFNECVGLTSIELPNTLIRIGNRAFYESGLLTVSIPNSVLYINGSAFSFCPSLTKVILPNSIIKLSGEAFASCNSLVIIDLTAFNSSDAVLNIANERVFDNINSNAKFYFKDQATLDKFAAVQYWSTLASQYTFTTDPVPSNEE